MAGYASVATRTLTGQCSGLLKTNAGADKGGLNKFVDNAKVGEDKNWPTGQIWDDSGKSIDGDTNSNAKAVAKDLTKLTPEEKTIVAGLLARTIEGGEVVEMCLSLSTET
ncbi:hypothetical protein ANAPC1_01220 [Anaplasma phagocytophilum]|uniref:Uncharacterized protein n=1 Tax=Anaplasma phagocytophilum TaxID=948 RepID=A0AA45ZI43_ANAPH|nr:hypothetical protein [Anaplasma phagocytophilum]SBO14848.1 hypothetical protein ANAPC1_01220 [Anaplasma phagocytophilum]